MLRFPAINHSINRHQYKPLWLKSPPRKVRMYAGAGAEIKGSEQSHWKAPLGSLARKGTLVTAPGAPRTPWAPAAQKPWRHWHRSLMRCHPPKLRPEEGVGRDASMQGSCAYQEGELPEVPSWPGSVILTHSPKPGLRSHQLGCGVWGARRDWDGEEEDSPPDWKFETLSPVPLFKTRTGRLDFLNNTPLVTEALVTTTLGT